MEEIIDPFDKLPDEVFQLIFAAVSDCKSLVRCMSVSKTFREQAMRVSSLSIICPGHFSSYDQKLRAIYVMIKEFHALESLIVRVGQPKDEPPSWARCMRYAEIGAAVEKFVFMAAKSGDFSEFDCALGASRFSREPNKHDIQADVIQSRQNEDMTLLCNNEMLVEQSRLPTESTVLDINNVNGRNLIGDERLTQDQPLTRRLENTIQTSNLDFNVQAENGTCVFTLRATDTSETVSNSLLQEFGSSRNVNQSNILVPSMLGGGNDNRLSIYGATTNHQNDVNTSNNIGRRVLEEQTLLHDDISHFGHDSQGLPDFNLRQVIAPSNDVLKRMVPVIVFAIVQGLDEFRDSIPEFINSFKKLKRFLLVDMVESVTIHMREQQIQEIRLQELKENVGLIKQNGRGCEENCTIGRDLFENLDVRFGQGKNNFGDKESRSTFYNYGQQKLERSTCVEQEPNKIVETNLSNDTTTVCDQVNDFRPFNIGKKIDLVERSYLQERYVEIDKEKCTTNQKGKGIYHEVETDNQIYEDQDGTISKFFQNKNWNDNVIAKDYKGKYLKEDIIIAEGVDNSCGSNQEVSMSLPNSDSNIWPTYLSTQWDMGEGSSRNVEVNEGIITQRPTMQRGQNYGNNIGDQISDDIPTFQGWSVNKSQSFVDHGQEKMRESKQLQQGGNFDFGTKGQPSQTLGVFETISTNHFQGIAGSLMENSLSSDTKANNFAIESNKLGDDDICMSTISLSNKEDINKNLQVGSLEIENDVSTWRTIRELGRSRSFDSLDSLKEEEEREEIENIEKERLAAEKTRQESKQISSTLVRNLKANGKTTSTNSSAKGKRNKNRFESSSSNIKPLGHRRSWKFGDISMAKEGKMGLAGKYSFKRGLRADALKRREGDRALRIGSSRNRGESQRSTKDENVIKKTELNGPKVEKNGKKDDIVGDGDFIVSANEAFCSSKEENSDFSKALNVEFRANNNLMEVSGLNFGGNTSNSTSEGPMVKQIQGETSNPQNPLTTFPNQFKTGDLELRKIMHTSHTINANVRCKQDIGGIGDIDGFWRPTMSSHHGESSSNKQYKDDGLIERHRGRGKRRIRENGHYLGWMHRKDKNGEQLRSAGDMQTERERMTRAELGVLGLEDRMADGETPWRETWRERVGRRVREMRRETQSQVETEQEREARRERLREGVRKRQRDIEREALFFDISFWRAEQVIAHGYCLSDVSMCIATHTATPLTGLELEILSRAALAGPLLAATVAHVNKQVASHNL